MNDMSIVADITKTEIRPLAFVTGFHEVRPVNQAYVEKLRAKIRDIGVKPYPLSVTPDGVLYGGRHRYEAFKAEGISECLMHIKRPESLDRESIQLNDTESALPMTFVDLAELIWRRLDAGLTQQALADELRWKRGTVSNYAVLKKISADAWKAVATTFQQITLPQSDDDVAGAATSVAFTEGLLRNITDLNPEQQLELVRNLAKGRNSKGHNFTKNDFKILAAHYRAYNALLEMAKAALEHLPEQWLAENAADLPEQLAQRSYIDEFLPKGETGPRFQRLIQSYLDAYAEAMNVRVLTKDIRALSDEDIADILKDGPIDAIVTDPPYPREFIETFDALGALAKRVLKPGGSLLCLCGQAYLPEYIERLSRHLDYHWTVGVHMPGGQAVQLQTKKVTAFWKPILWFTNGPREPGEILILEEGEKNPPKRKLSNGAEWASDFIRTDVNNNDKAHHKWGQSEQIVEGMVDRATLAGERVLDPFLGGGTTGVVCRKKKRKFIGIDINSDVVKAAQKRIGGE